MAKKKAPTVREDQEYMPGMEPVMNKRVHTAAKRYAKLRDSRMKANEEEKAAHTSLLEIMIEEKLESYEYKGLEVHIDSTRKCKVTTPDGGSGKKADAEGDEE